MLLLVRTQVADLHRELFEISFVKNVRFQFLKKGYYRNLNVKVSKTLEKREKIHF